jgi:hypothetical protein
MPANARRRARKDAVFVALHDGPVVDLAAAVANLYNERDPRH